MLVVVENRDIASRLELFFDFKTAGSADVFKIYAAERAGNVIHCFNYFVNVLCPYAERKRVNAAEFLEEHAFALHNRHTRLGSDIAESQNGGAVGNYRNHIPAAGKLPAFVIIFLDCEAGLRDARSVRERQCVLIVDLCAGDDFDLALPFGVKFK